MLGRKGMKHSDYMKKIENDPEYLKGVIEMMKAEKETKVDRWSLILKIWSGLIIGCSIYLLTQLPNTFVGGIFAMILFFGIIMGMGLWGLSNLK